jgi:hypothetical protein
MLLQLMKYVHSSTRRLHENDIAPVLDRMAEQHDSFFQKHPAIRKGRHSTPDRLITGTALKELWRHAAQYHFR